ncbi:MAG: type II secretion system major pseudopilin GspG [Desulfobacteraceae bacterium]|jgi:general secretion pathway protein G
MQRTTKRLLLAKQGFTLIELLVVILILGLLAGIVGPRLFGHADEAKQTKARVQIENFSSALKMYKLDNGQFPTTEQGLEALVTQPQSGDIPKKWKKGGYMAKKQIPKDPWGNDYVYLYPGVHDDFDITSYGADKVPGGEDFNRDINSWEIDE